MKQIPEKDIVKILLPLPIDTVFTYSNPADKEIKPESGQLVLVPFGRSRKLIGIVLESNAPYQDEKTRSIDSIFKKDLNIPKVALEFWSWVSEYYLVPEGLVMELAFTGIMNLKSKEKYWRTEKRDEFFGQSSNFLPKWISERDSWTPREIKKVADTPLLKKLISEGYLYRTHDIIDEFKPFTKEVIGLTPHVTKSEKKIERTLKSLSRAKVQKKGFEILLEKFFDQKGEPFLMTTESLIVEGVSRGAINQLETKGVIIRSRKEIPRISHVRTEFRDARKQEPASRSLSSSRNLEPTIEAINLMVEKGRQVFILLPEDNQVQSFADRLVNAGLSGLNVISRSTSRNTKREIFEAVSKKAIGPVIGTQSIVLYPFQQLALVIIVNEHHQLYKRKSHEMNLNYKDMAMKLAAIHNADLIALSDSPTLETLNLIQRGKAQEVEKALNGPDITIIDKREQWRKNLMKGSFSKRAIEKIRECIESGRQVLVLQNRKGYSSYIECQECHHIPHCPNCDISLTYFKAEDVLKCRYCGEIYPNSPTCPNGHNEYRTIGIGIEQIEEEIGLLLPEHQTLRVDSEAIRSKREFERVKREFEQQKFQILVTTHYSFFKFNFGNIGLAVIPNFDQYLNLPDFRNHEHAFQVLSDVHSFFDPGIRSTIILQTASKSTELLHLFENWDYQAFARTELEERREFDYPPFVRMIKISSIAKNSYSGEIFLTELAEMLGKSHPPKFILGPFTPMVKKVRNEYIHHLYIKERPNESKLKELKQKLKNYRLNQEEKLKKGGVTLEFDVDTNS